MDNESIMKVASIFLLVVGAGLLYWGYQESGSLSSQLSETFTGSASDSVMYKYIGGAAGIAAGLFLLVRK
jgi:hypothetical protein